MPITMDEESKIRKLNILLDEHETYIATTWASIQNNTPKLMTYAIPSDKRPKIGSRNIYCYVGLTTTHLNIVTLNPLDITRTTGSFKIPLCDFHNISFQNGLLKHSGTFEFEQEKIKITWMNQASGTDMKTQKDNVKTIVHHLSDHH